jgi:hypothetical protein
VGWQVQDGLIQTFHKGCLPERGVGGMRALLVKDLLMSSESPQAPIGPARETIM